jgi:L-ribulose-5-phosphate 3-epimerase
MEKGKISRRELIVKGAQVASAGVAGVPWLQAKTAQAGFKIGACDWTLGKRADPAALVMAKRLGLDGIQVDVGGPKNGMPVLKAEVQKLYLETAAKQQVEIGSLAIGSLNDVPYKSDPRAEQWVSDSIDACQALGVKVVLLAFFAKGDLLNDPEGVAAVVQRLRKVAPKAERADVTLGFESWLSAEQHMDILNRVGSPAVKVYYDVANSHKQGYDIYKEIRLLGKNICEFHAKDYDDLYGKGSIDFNRVRLAMDDIGYRGWLHMEGTKLPLGLEESIKYDERYLRSVFPRVVQD